MFSWLWKMCEFPRNDPIWINLGRNELGGVSRIQILPVYYNPNFALSYEMHHREFEQKHGDISSNTALRRKMYSTVLADACVLSWDGMINRDKEEIPCRAQIVEDNLNRLDWLFWEVLKTAFYKVDFDS